MFPCTPSNISTKYKEREVHVAQVCVVEVQVLPCYHSDVSTKYQEKEGSTKYLKVSRKRGLCRRGSCS